MKTKDETIEAGEHGDAWRCLCGNRPWEEGFFPINEGVRIVEPTPEEWRTNEYVCDRCGRMIDAETLRVTRQVDPQLILRE